MEEILRNEPELYPPSYFAENGYGLDVRRAMAYQQERARVMYYHQSGSILDYGCGTGDFLAGFDAQSWARFGVELSPYGRMMCRAKGLQVQPPEGSWNNRYYDVIVFRGTIQHIDKPFDVIRQTSERLLPGGLMAFLATPNSNSLVYKLFGDLPALDWERNWWIPGARELSNVLAHCDMRIDKIIFPYAGGPYARPARDTWGFIQRLFGRRVKFAWPGNMMEVYAVRL